MNEWKVVLDQRRRMSLWRYYVFDSMVCFLITETLLWRRPRKAPRADSRVKRRAANTRQQESKICESECGGELNTKNCWSSYFSIHRHAVVHKEKRFACDKCGYKASEMRFLKKHSMVHTREQPYTCPECQKGFSCISNMRKHFMSAHGAENALYKCGECRFTTNYRADLKLHNCLRYKWLFRHISNKNIEIPPFYLWRL